jgi:hypothetical protein
MIPGFGRSEVVIIYPEIYTYILMYIDHAKSNPTIPSNPHVSPLRVLEASPGLAGRQSWFGRSKVFSLLGKWTSPILMGYYIKYVGILYMKKIYIYIDEILTSNGILNCIFMGYEWNIDITLVSRRLVVVSIGIIQNYHEKRASDFRKSTQSLKQWIKSKWSLNKSTFNMWQNHYQTNHIF